MKWSLQQLLKIGSFPHYFEEEFDFTEEIDQIDDIIGISPVNITGRIICLDEKTYQFIYHIHAPLILQCALTLDPVEYIFDEDYDEIYSTIPSDDYYLIEKNTIDTRKIVWSNLIIDKPINVTKENAYEILKERGINLNDTPEIDDDDEVISFSDGRHFENEDK